MLAKICKLIMLVRLATMRSHIRPQSTRRGGWPMLREGLIQAQAQTLLVQTPGSGSEQASGSGSGSGSGWALWAPVQALVQSSGSGSRISGSGSGSGSSSFSPLLPLFRSRLVAACRAPLNLSGSNVCTWQSSSLDHQHHHHLQHPSFSPSASVSLSSLSDLAWICHAHVLGS